MKTRMVKEYYFNLEKKLIEHPKGKDFLKIFEITMSIPNDILEESLYFTTNINEIGKERDFYEVLNVYFINPYQSNNPDGFHIAEIRNSLIEYIYKNTHLSDETLLFWSNNIKENVKNVYEINWMFDFSYKTNDIKNISKDSNYYDFVHALYSNIKEEYKVFFNTEYTLTDKEIDLKIQKSLCLWVGDNGKYQCVTLIDSYFKTKESEYKRITQEFCIYSTERINKCI